MGNKTCWGLTFQWSTKRCMFSNIFDWTAYWVGWIDSLPHVRIHLQDPYLKGLWYLKNRGSAACDGGPPFGKSRLYSNLCGTVFRKTVFWFFRSRTPSPIFRSRGRSPHLGNAILGLFGPIRIDRFWNKIATFIQIMLTGVGDHLLWVQGAVRNCIEEFDYLSNLRGTVVWNNVFFARLYCQKCQKVRRQASKRGSRAGWIYVRHLPARS